MNRIVSRLLLGFLLLSPLPLSVLAWLYTSEFERMLTATVRDHLAAIADKKADQINAYLDERLADGQMLAHSLATREALRALSPRTAAAAPGAAASEHYRRYFQALYDSVGYYDLLLMDVAGNVVFSILREDDLGTNLVTGPYRDSPLARGHREALALLGTQITPVGRYAPSGDRPAIFVVTPVIEDGRAIGTAALQLDLERLGDVTADVTGLGESGETVLAQLDGDQVLYVGALRHVADAAFHHRVPIDRAAAPMRAALRGDPGLGRTRDYVGIDIVAVWRYLPALRWGMVVKMDAAEALAAARELRVYSLGALLLLLLLAAGAALLYGRSLVGPVRQLTRATQRIAAGELRHRAQAQGCDEFRQMAESFNRMADRLTEEQARLEERVRERTTALSEAKLAAEAANRAKSAFLANMSHEIRTPMNAILGLTRATLDAGLPERQADFLRKTLTAGHALLDILNDILDYSKLEFERMRIERAPMRVAAVLAESAGLFQARLEEKALRLRVHVAAEMPEEVLGDALRLAQVLNNLLGNAIKFTARGGIDIEATVAPAATPDTRTLRFSVRDSGIGLDEAQAARLFEPFSQADASTTREYGGTGLGLAICRKLVKLMGGDIEARGKLGEGATFAFSIVVGLPAGGERPSGGADPARETTRWPATLATDAHAAPLRAPGDERRWQALSAVLEAIRPMLQEHELVADDALIVLRRLADDDPADVELARLLSRIDQFDHEGALASVDELRALRVK